MLKQVKPMSLALIAAAAFALPSYAADKGEDASGIQSSKEVGNTKGQGPRQRQMSDRSGKGEDASGTQSTKDTGDTKGQGPRQRQSAKPGWTGEDASGAQSSKDIGVAGKAKPSMSKGPGSTGKPGSP